MGRAGWAAALALSMGAAQAGEYTIKSFRWEEDYSYLAARAPADDLEALKFISLNDDRDAWLTLGADTRFRVDLIENGAFSLRPGGDYTTVTTRVLFHTDWHFDDALRAFVQFGFHDENGRRPQARPFDEGAIDLQQAFADIDLFDAVRVRAGRQELPLGNQRLSDVREGGNIRRSFDGVRADVNIVPAKVVFFAASPVANGQENFDDEATRYEAFYGAYATVPVAWTGGSADIFWLHREKPNSVFATGTADDARSTVGARFFGNNGVWDYDVEALWQFGTFGADDVRAYAASVDAGWRAVSWPWQPRFSVRFDLGSGDGRAGDGELLSFDGPYPNFSYLSATSSYWPGNAWTVFPLLTATPNDDLTLYFGAQYMARLETGDAFYYQPQVPIALPGTIAHGLMTQMYTRLRWQPTRHWQLTATAIYQAAGVATNDAGGEDTFIGSTSVSWRF
ncbi:MAG: alginate export family protein [Micropepsaceae bacterium]